MKRILLLFSACLLSQIGVAQYQETIALFYAPAGATEETPQINISLSKTEDGHAFVAFSFGSTDRFETVDGRYFDDALRSFKQINPEALFSETQETDGRTFSVSWYSEKGSAVYSLHALSPADYDKPAAPFLKVVLTLLESVGLDFLYLPQ
ncbi:MULTISPECIES: hypothetical protein [unclassified Flavobacterium]|uniref:hypothetical protein n=1 Tax=unclassified Flavobacterium TaxID=196869 RepID=UPI001F145960|nr:MULTISPECIES: hypothetical protein [unclassified Flavobacterium]UMY66050.1 hypothetical protein MKO97_01335 [Flavobacterium sp. HJ-32-4]